jgi:hypothetical protein
VYHIKIIATTKNGSHDMKQTDSSIIIVRNVWWSTIGFQERFICIESIKVILHQFWMKKSFPWKFNLEYGGTFTKLFMYVSSRKNNIYIPCVPHKNNCNNKKWFTRHETDRFLNNHCQECVRAYLKNLLLSGFSMLCSWFYFKLSDLLRENI